MTSLKQRTCAVLGRRNEPGLIVLLPTKQIRELRHIFWGQLMFFVDIIREGAYKTFLVSGCSAVWERT